MTMRWTGATTLTVLLLALTGLAYALTLDLGGKARLVPMAVLVPTIFLLALELALDVVPALKRGFSIFDRPELLGEKGARESAHVEAPGGASRVRGASRGARAEATMLGWVFAMLVVVILMGFVIGAPLYTLAYGMLRAGQRWTAALGLAVTVAAVTIGVFQMALGRQLWTGLLWSWLGF